MFKPEVKTPTPARQQFAPTQSMQIITSKNSLLPIPETFLNENAILKLEAFKITSALKFVEANTQFLSNLLRTPEIEVERIKNKIISEKRPQLQNAFEQYETLKTFYVLTTGIENLDELLYGGLQENGYILEICGIAGVGKSFLCQTIACNLAINFNIEILWISTKRNQIGTKFWKIFNAKNIENIKIENLMKKIQIGIAFTPEKLIETLKSIQNNIDELKCNNFKILIIDCISTLWYQFPENDIRTREILLNEIILILKQLAIKYKIIIICVNLLIRWVEDCQSNIDDCDTKYGETSIFKRNMFANEFPALGKFWFSIPNTRIQMDFVIKKNNSFQLTSRPDHIFSSCRSLNRRGLKIIKSNSFDTGKSCLIQLSNSGVS